MCESTPEQDRLRKSLRPDVTAAAFATYRHEALGLFAEGKRYIDGVAIEFLLEVISRAEIQTRCQRNRDATDGPQ